ncbi:PAS domain S-box protein, partial [Acinetobacter baumannii]|uniref:PAS domain S-box protein n=1 Tax=Acinetobacter baumannii TaxID=470 RepID=UPI00189C2756
MFTSLPTANAAFLVDETGHIASWNHACEKLLGFAARDVIGEALGTLLTGIDPADSGERWRGLVADHGHTNKVVLRHADGGTVKA